MRLQIIYLLVILACAFYTLGQQQQPCVDGQPCDDNNECTTDDTCFGGYCIGNTKNCGNQVCDPYNGACVDCLSNGDCRFPPGPCLVGQCTSNICSYPPLQCPSPFVCNATTGQCSIASGPPTPRCNPNIQTLMNNARVFQLNSATTSVSSTTYTIITRLPTRGTLYRFVDYTHPAGGHIPYCADASHRTATDIRNYAMDLLTPTTQTTNPNMVITGTTVSQTTAGASASAYIYPAMLSYVYELTGTFTVSNDINGFIGLVFGYKSSTDYFLIAMSTARNGPNGVLRRINSQMTNNNTRINTLNDIIPNVLFNGISNQISNFTLPLVANTRYNYILTVDTMGGYIQFDVAAGSGAYVKVLSGNSPAYTTANGFAGFFNAINTRTTFSALSICNTINPQIISTGVLTNFTSNVLRRVVYVPPKNIIGPQNGFDWVLSDGRTNSLQCQQRVTVMPYRDIPIAFSLNYNLNQGDKATLYFVGTSVESPTVTPVVLQFPDPRLGTLYQCIDVNGQCTRGAAVQNVIQDSQGRALLELNPNIYGTNQISFYVIDSSGDGSRPAVLNLNVAPGVLTTTLTSQTFIQNGGVQNFTLTSVGGSMNYTTYYTIVHTLPSYVGNLQYINGNGQTINVQDGTRIPAQSVVQYIPAPNSLYNDGTANNYPAPASFVYNANNGDQTSPSQYVPVSVQVPNNSLPQASKPNMFYTGTNGSVLGFQGMSPSGSPLTMCISSLPSGTLYQVNTQTINGQTTYTRGQLVTPTPRVIPGTGNILCLPVNNTAHAPGSPYTVSRLYYVPGPNQNPNNPNSNPLDQFTYVFTDGKTVSKPESIAQITTLNGPARPTAGPVIPKPIVIPYNSSTGQVVQLAGTDQGADGTPALFHSGIFITNPCRNGTMFQRTADNRIGAPIDPTNGPVAVTNPNGQIVIVPLKGTSGQYYCYFSFIVQSNATKMVSDESFIPVSVSAPTTNGGNGGQNGPFYALATTAMTQVNKSVPITLKGAPDNSNPSTVSAYITQYPTKGNLYQYSPTGLNNMGSQIPNTASTTNPVLVSDPMKRVVFMPAPGQSASQPGRGVPNYYTSFQYAVRNGSAPYPTGLSTPASVDIGVKPQNLPPTPTKRSIQTTMNTPLSFYLTATDPDTAQRFLTYTVLDTPQRGSLHIVRQGDKPSTNNTVRLVPGRGGVLTPVNVPGGALTYVPPKNVVSGGDPLIPIDDFTYTVYDGTTRVLQKVQVYVTPTDNNTMSGGNNNNNNNSTSGPQATTQSPQNVPQGTTPGPVRISGVDPVYPDSQLTYIITKLPTKGSLQQGNNVPITRIGTAVAHLVDDKTRNPLPFETVFYAATNPAANGNNYDSFTYVVQNPAGGRSAPKTIQINVTPVPHTPIAKILSVPTTNETASFLIIDLGAVDPDVNNQQNPDVLTAFITQSTTKGRLFQVDSSNNQLRPNTNAPISINTPNGVGVQVNTYRPKKNQAGSIAYIRPANLVGNGVDQVTFYVKDSTNRVSKPLTFSINVRPTNSAPIALGLGNLDGVVHVPANYASSIAVTWKADSSRVRVTLTGFPDIGKFVNTDMSRLDRDYPVVKNGGAFIYEAAKGFVGVQKFTYTVTDLNNNLTSQPLDVYIQVA